MSETSYAIMGIAVAVPGMLLVRERRFGLALAGAFCLAAAVCLLVNGGIAALGRPVAVNVITAAGLWTLGLRMLLGGTAGYRPLGLVIIAASAVPGVLAVLAWGSG